MVTTTEISEVRKRRQKQDKIFRYSMTILAIIFVYCFGFRPSWLYTATTEINSSNWWTDNFAHFVFGMLFCWVLIYGDRLSLEPPIKWVRNIIGSCMALAAFWEFAIEMPYDLWIHPLIKNSFPDPMQKGNLDTSVDLLFTFLGAITGLMIWKIWRPIYAYLLPKHAKEELLDEMSELRKYSIKRVREILENFRAERKEENNNRKEQSRKANDAKPKKLFFLIFILSLMLSENALAGSVDEKLNETLELSKEVKKFGETLGIPDSGALSEISTDKNPSSSVLWMWSKKRGTISPSLDLIITFLFAKPKEEIPLEKIRMDGNYSYYYRSGNESNDKQKSFKITPSFSEQSTTRITEVILHEDLHGSFENSNANVEEALITPLGKIAAFEFFVSKGHMRLANRVETHMIRYLQKSRELLALRTHAEDFFKKYELDEARQKLLETIKLYPKYHNEFAKHLIGQSEENALEAKLSHDLSYYIFFEKIYRIFNKSKDLKRLIADLKEAPNNFEEAERYLDGLLAKHKETPY